MAGLLGMGGFGGLNNKMPTGLLKGNLAALFNPTSMRNQQIKQGLLNAGIAMMNPDPHAPPAGIGGVLGRAAAGGFQGAQQAKNDFYNDGMLNMQLMDMQRQEDERAKREAGLAELLPMLPPDIQAFAKYYPDKVMDAYIGAKMGGGNPTDDMREYDQALKDPRFRQYLIDMKQAGASRTNIDTGTVPQGYQAVRDEQGRLVRYDPVPGGPADNTASDATRAENQQTSTDVITGAAANIRKLTQEPFTTGLIGAGASINPASNAAEVYRQVEVLKSNAKAENLQAMRMASPTGGALGNVSNTDIALLATKSGALDPRSPYFPQQLDDYERTLLRIVHGQKGGDAIFEQTRQAQQQEPPPIDATPEEVEHELRKRGAIP
jgi:hypothetical protein